MESMRSNPSITLDKFINEWSANEIAWLIFSILLVIGINIYAFTKTQNKPKLAAIRGITLFVSIWFIFKMFLHDKITIINGIEAYSAISISSLLMCSAFMYNKNRKGGWPLIAFFGVLTAVIFTSVYYMSNDNMPLGISFMAGLIIGWILFSFINSAWEILSKKSKDNDEDENNTFGTSIDW